MTDNPYLAPGAVVQTRDGREAKVLEYCPDRSILEVAVKSADGWVFGVRWLEGRVERSRIGPGDLIIVPPVHPDLAGTRTWRVYLIPNMEGEPPDNRSELPHALITLTDGISPHECVKVVMPGDGL